MIIHKSKFSKIWLDKNSNILYQVWNKKTKKIKDKIFKKEMLKLQDAIKSFFFDFLLVDMIDFYYFLSPNVQNWVNTNVNRLLLDKKIKKIAFIVDKKNEENITVQECISEKEGSELNWRNFSNYKNAIKWFNQEDDFIS